MLPGADATVKDAQPRDARRHGDRPRTASKLYVAAFGSSKVGVFNTADLDNDALGQRRREFDPIAASADYIDVSGGGPGGLVLDERERTASTC